MNRQQMLEFMPHRGRNVLIDGFADTGEGTGRGLLTIAEGDELGRDLFLVRGPDGLRYSSFFLVEHAALTSILILRSDMGGGRLAYFSAIQKFQSHATVPVGVPLVSDVSRGRDRAEFRSFAAKIATEDGEPVLDVSFMAYLAPRGATPGEGRRGMPDGRFPPPDPGWFPCFDPALVFLGGTSETGERGGVYPADHPLCEGHFPGAPVMMGMTQWMTVAEAAAIAAPAGESEVSGSGRIATADGRPVVEIADLRAAVTKDAEGRVRDLRLLGTRKVAFRDRILPGDAYVAEWRPA